MVNVRKRGNFYQYQFEVAPINGKRKQVTKSGFKSIRLCFANACQKIKIGSSHYGCTTYYNISRCMFNISIFSSSYIYYWTLK